MKSILMKLVKYFMLFLFVFLMGTGIGTICHKQIVEALEQLNLSSYMRNKIILQISNINTAKMFNNVSTIKDAYIIRGSMRCLLPSINDIEKLPKSSQYQLLQQRINKIAEIELSYEKTINKLSESGSNWLQKISNINQLRKLQVTKSQQEAKQVVNYLIKILPTQIEINKIDPSFQNVFKFAVLAKKNQIKLAYIQQVQSLVSQQKPKVKLQSRNINSTFKCPSPELIVRNKNNAGVYYANDQHWLNNYMGWAVPDVISFMQVIIYNTGNVECYYNWPSPKEQGTKLWMTVKLSSDVTQKIQPFGTYWNVNKDNKLCSSGIDSCAMRSKKRK